MKKAKEVGGPSSSGQLPPVTHFYHRKKLKRKKKKEIKMAGVIRGVATPQDKIKNQTPLLKKDKKKLNGQGCKEDSYTQNKN